MSRTREIYLVVEAGDFAVGLQLENVCDAENVRRDRSDLTVAMTAFSALGDVEAAIRTRWPGRAYWIEQDLGDGARYQLVEYGAFANKPHKQVAR